MSGYDDVVQANDNFLQGRDEVILQLPAFFMVFYSSYCRRQIKSVIFIDCGATVDLAELLSVSPEMLIYLLDSHRPYSLYNVFNNSQVRAALRDFCETPII